MAIETGNVIKIGVVITALVVAAVLFARSDRKSGPGGAPDSVYYYDLKTGTLFPGPFSATPPIAAPSGGADQGVLATVMSCGDCSDAQRQTVMLQTYSPQAKAAMTGDAADVNPQKIAEGSLVASPPDAGKDVKWVVTSSPQGRALAANVQSMCGERQPPTVCLPQ